MYRERGSNEHTRMDGWHSSVKRSFDWSAQLSPCFVPTTLSSKSLHIKFSISSIMSAGTGMDDPLCTACWNEFENISDINYSGKTDILCGRCYRKALESDLKQAENPIDTDTNNVIDKELTPASTSTSTSSSAAWPTNSQQNDRSLKYKKLKSSGSLVIDVN